VDKRNGQRGCARFRRLEINDMIGVAHTMSLWRRRRRPGHATQYGFTPHRQRLHAILGVRLQRWRLHMLQAHSLTILFDAVNAFPSMSWDELDRGTDFQAEPENGRLLRTRYHRTASLLTDSNDHCLVARPQTGDKQGNGPAAERFVLAQDPRLEAWFNKTTSVRDVATLARRDSDVERWHTPKHWQFADDTARATGACSVLELVKRIQEFIASLREATRPLKIEQCDRPGKLQLLIRLATASPRAERILNGALIEAGLQRTRARTAVHLGGLHEEDGGHGAEVERALRRGQAQWNTWRGYLLDEGIAFAKRCVMIRATVQFPMLAGLEICVLTRRQVTRMEVAVCKKLSYGRCCEEQQPAQRICRCVNVVVFTRCSPF